MKNLYIVPIMLALCWSCNKNNSAEIKTHTMSDKNADISLKYFYSTLHSRLNEGVMLGHQDALAYGNMWYGENGRSDFKSVSGNEPAVVGWDLGKIEVNSVLNKDSVSFEKIKEYVKKVEKMNGVTTFNWTAENPADTSDLNVIASLLPGNKNHNKYITYLDRISNFFLNLKNDKDEFIPVIFRPFNNPLTTANWWNIKNNTPEEYKELWKLTVNYLRNKKNVHHILYAYSVYAPENESDFNIAYPGDPYVDIIGADIYLDLESDPHGQLYKKELDKSLTVTTKFAEKYNKIAALTDTGLKGIKLSNFFTSLVEPVVLNHKISYILFGRNAWNIEEYYHIPVPGHPASEDFAEFANSPRILTIKKFK